MRGLQSHRPDPPGARGKVRGIKPSLALPSKSCFMPVSVHSFIQQIHIDCMLPGSQAL